MEGHIPSCSAKPYIRQLLIRKQKRRHFQCGHQGYILQRVIQYRQQGRHATDFRKAEIAFCPVKVDGHTLLLQKLRQRRPDSRHLWQQNDHVPVFIPADCTVFLQALRQQKFDPVYHRLAFRLQVCY